MSRGGRRKRKWDPTRPPRRRLGCLQCQGSPIPGWVQGAPAVVNGTVHDNNVTPCLGCNATTAQYVAKTKGSAASVGIPSNLPMDHQQRAAGER